MIHSKFDEDLDGLLRHLDDGLWGGHINHFIFLVNTIDRGLPEDSENYYQTSKARIVGQRPYDFKCIVGNLDYIQNLLEEIDDLEVLQKLSARITSRIDIDPSSIDTLTMIKLIREISKSLADQYISSSPIPDYTRISSSKKIELNNLEERKDTIEACIAFLGIVNKAVSSLNQSPSDSEIFETTKNFIISRYRVLSETFDGVELFDSICRDLESYTNADFHGTPVRMLVVYTFDLCDIFKKETD